jgi:hypothetical protein
MALPRASRAIRIAGAFDEAQEAKDHSDRDENQRDQKQQGLPVVPSGIVANCGDDFR